jgi:putative transposase
MSAHYKVAWLCEALLVSRSGYYDWKDRRSKPGPREVESIHLRERIREEFARSRQTYGSPRIAHALGCPGRRNRIARLMCKERLYARQRSKYRAATTDSRHGGPIAPNRLRGLTVQRLDQIWATDATCVLTAQGWLYLVAVLDLFSPGLSVGPCIKSSMLGLSLPLYAWRSLNVARSNLSSFTPIAVLSSPALLTGKS